MIIRDADPARGRFRGFLLTALKRYVINEHERATAARRGGSQLRFALDFDEAERTYASGAGADDTPDRVFDRKWASLCLDRALASVRAEYEAAGKGRTASVLLPYLTESGELPPYRAAAAAAAGQRRRGEGGGASPASAVRRRSQAAGGRYGPLAGGHR